MKGLEKWAHLYEEDKLEPEHDEKIITRRKEQDDVTDKCGKCEEGRLSFKDFFHAKFYVCNECDYRLKVDDSGETTEKKTKKPTKSYNPKIETSSSILETKNRSKK